MGSACCRVRPSLAATYAVSHVPRERQDRSNALGGSLNGGYEQLGVGCLQKPSIDICSNGFRDLPNRVSSHWKTIRMLVMHMPQTLRIHNGQKIKSTSSAPHCAPRQAKRRAH